MHSLPPVDPNRNLKLGTKLAVVGLTSLAPLALPPQSGLAIVPPLIGVAGSIAAIGQANQFEFDDDRLAEQRARFAALAADMEDQILLSSQAFYSLNPSQWQKQMPVPSSWHDQYIAAKFSQPAPQIQQLQPLAAQPIAQPQNQWVQPIPYPTPPTSHEGTIAQAQQPDPARPQWTDDLSSLSAHSQTRSDHAWVEEVICYPSVLVYGAPGGGKSTFADSVVEKRLLKGQQVFALDPHYEPHKWHGAIVKGAGFNYDEIAFFLPELLHLIKRRYQEFGRGVKTFQPLTIVCEELTNWSSRVEGSEQLIEIIPDGRKIGVNLLFVSHDRTITSLGGKSGLSKMLKTTLLEVELLAKPDPNSPTGVSPTGFANFKRPNQDPIRVTVPKPKIQQPSPNEPPQNQVEPLTPSGIELNRFEFDNPVEPTPNPPQNASIAPVEPNPIAPDEGKTIERRFAEMKGLGMNKAQIIFMLWQVKKGDSNRYRMASEFYEKLSSNYQEKEA